MTVSCPLYLLLLRSTILLNIKKIIWNLLKISYYFPQRQNRAESGPCDHKAWHAICCKEPRRKVQCPLNRMLPNTYSMNIYSFWPAIITSGSLAIWSDSLFNQFFGDILKMIFCLSFYDLLIFFGRIWPGYVSFNCPLTQNIYTYIIYY
jgi:hypothetical protein